MIFKLSEKIMLLLNILPLNFKFIYWLIQKWQLCFCDGDAILKHKITSYPGGMLVALFVCTY